MKTEPSPTNLTVIGRNVRVSLHPYVADVLAKVDTGADSSSIWASGINVMPDGVLEFCLFAPESPLYTGEVIRRKEYTVALVRSSSGHLQIRYRVTFRVQIKNRTVRMACNLSDRSLQKFPMLIGRRSLSGKFIVDVRQHDVIDETPSVKRGLRNALAKNPYDFHRNYYQKDVE